MALALPDLIALAILIVAYGLISAGQAFVNFLHWLLSNTVGSIPFVGSIFEGVGGQALQQLSNYLGSAASAFEAGIGWCFRQLAQELEWVGRELEGLGLLADATIERLAREAARAAISEVVHVEHLVRTDVVERTVDTVHDVTHVVSQTSTVADEALRARVSHLEHAIDQTLDPSVEWLRERTRALENDLQTAYDLIREHGEALSIAGITSATAVALGELGASWVRCEGAGVVGRKLCGIGPQLLEALLDGGLAALAVDDVCAILKGATALALSEPVQASLAFSADEISKLLVCVGAEVGAPLNTAYAAPGPVTMLGAPGVVGV